MKTRTNTGIAALAFATWQFVSPSLLHAQESSSPELTAEYVRQDEIYQRQRVSRGYVIDRTLDGYVDMLPDEFDDVLAGLGPDDRWLDIGAGQGEAILDYYTPRFDKLYPGSRKQRGKKAKSVAISIEDRRTARWHQSAAALEAGKVQYKHGKRLREYSPEELGRFRLISDVMGGFSYAADLSRFMQSVMQLLEVDGSFFTTLQDVELESRANKPWYEGYPFTTEIESPAGQKMTVCAWLKIIGCAEVRCEAKPDRRPPREVYHVRKVCNDISVPPLVTTDFQAGTPPQRGYRLAKPRASR